MVNQLRAWSRSGSYWNCMLGVVLLGLAIPGVGIAQTNWTGSVNNRWSPFDSGNWSAGTPNSIDAEATLGAVITGNTTIQVTNPFWLGFNPTVGTLNITGGQDFTLRDNPVWWSLAPTLFFETSSGSAEINISGSNSSTIEDSLSVTLRDNLVIDQSGTGVFTIDSDISDSGTRSLTHSGTGTTVLTGSNTYGGSTSLLGGTLSVNDLSNGGSSSGIGDSSSSSSNLVFDGGTLRYTGSGDSTDRAFTLGTGGGTIDSSGSGALDWTNTGGLSYSGSGNRTLTLTGTNAGTNELAADIANGSGGTTSIVKTGTGTWRLSGDNTMTGSVNVNNGILELDSSTVNGAVPGALIVGDGIGAANSAIARNFQEGQVGNSSTVTVYSDGWFDINGGAYPNKVGPSPLKDETVGQVNLYGGRITTGSGGSLNIDPGDPGDGITAFSSPQTALIDATGGQLNLNGDRTITVADGSQTTDLEIRGAIVSEQNGPGSVTKEGDGRLSFTGSEANTYTGETVVNGGTLELKKSDGVTSIAGSQVTVNSGGTLLLSANNQINDAANLTLNNGTLDTGTGFSETLGTLTLSGNSVIDLGAASHLLSFEDSSAASWSGTLTIYGWQTLENMPGTNGRIFFGNNSSGLTQSQLDMISFNGFAGPAILLSSGELVPSAIPELPVALTALALGTLILWRERRRIKSLLPRRPSDPDPAPDPSTGLASS